MASEPYIRCPSCKSLKARAEFAKNRCSKSGLGSYCKRCHNRIVRENREKNHGSIRSFWLQRRYGVDAVQIEWMILQQGGVCAICATRPAVHVDHDHATGAVWGVLCFNCNRGIAKLGEDVVLMRAAVAYLTEGLR